MRASYPLPARSKYRKLRRYARGANATRRDPAHAVFGIVAREAASREKCGGDASARRCTIGRSRDRGARHRRIACHVSAAGAQSPLGEMQSSREGVHREKSGNEDRVAVGACGEARCDISQSSGRAKTSRIIVIEMKVACRVIG